MPIRRSKFLTVVFSCLPGAGQMFMGLLKTGLSLMSAFFFIIFIAGFFDFNALMFFLPIIWFYSFFDSVNRMSMPDENFYAQEDDFLFSLDTIFSGEKRIVQKYRPYIGGALIFMGAYIIWSKTYYRLDQYLAEPFARILSNITDLLPQFAIAAVIILIGVKLIIGKHKEVQ